MAWRSGARQHGGHLRIGALRSPLLPLYFLLLLAASTGATRIALIGDFGDDSTSEGAVSAMIKGWDAADPLAAVVTLGDNNYNDGLAKTIQANIGKYYDWILNRASAAANRFWPLIGNHDWSHQCGDRTKIAPYLDYFKTVLAGKNEAASNRYYDITFGPDLHFFLLDSDCNEPDGRTASSAQAAWLKAKLAASTAPIKIVAMHHSPFSSARHGPIKDLQWPYEDWGADLVLSAHDHTYERLDNPRNTAGKDGFPYVVNGLGGKDIYKFRRIQPASQVRYNGLNGALLLASSSQALGGTLSRYSADLSFYSSDGVVRDCYRIIKTLDSASGASNTTYAAGAPQCPAAGSSEFSVLTSSAVPSPPASPGQRWAYLNGARRQQRTSGRNSFAAIGFDDSQWVRGPAPLGYGSPGLAWATALSPGSSSGTAYYHFRTTFCLTAAGAAQLPALFLKVSSDKRAKVWVNGALTVNEARSTTHSARYWNARAILKAGTLVAGTNVITAQVASPAKSGSAGFDLDLTYWALAGINATAPCA